MRTINEILDKIIEFKGLKNDTALAKLLNVKPTTVSNWRKRSTVPYDLIVSLCEEEGLSLNWLLTGQVATKHAGTEEKSRKKDLSHLEHAGEPGFTYVPQVSGRISAGTGFAPENSIEMRVAFRKEWIARKGSAKDMVLIKVSGDSMQPTLLNGDLVLIDRGRNYLEPQGGVYAIALDDVIMIKRIQPIGDRVRIISDNKMYEAFEVQADQAKINGKVIWFARELER